LADADGSIAAELDVHGWPTLLIISASGIELARLSGSPETAPVALPAYVDLAAGKMQALRVDTAAHGIVGDKTATKNARDVRKVEYLIVSGNADEALKLLMSLPEGALVPWRHNLLGARALAMLNRWPEAKQAAEAALAQNGDLAEAHYLLGQFYERANDWRRAAAEYRAAMSGAADHVRSGNR
jgi:tetratricopeptide (TPR) repeat protein